MHVRRTASRLGRPDRVAWRAPAHGSRTNRHPTRSATDARLPRSAPLAAHRSFCLFHVHVSPCPCEFDFLSHKVLPRDLLAYIAIHAHVHVQHVHVVLYDTVCSVSSPQCR